MKKLITNFYDIRNDEWKQVLLIFSLHFILMVILYFLKPARDSLFLTENGPSELPFVYILLAVVSIPISQVLSDMMSRYPIRTVLIWTLGFLLMNLLLLRWLFRLQMDWIFMAFYVWVGIFGILVISLFWILANSVFKPAQSKRIFPFLTLGAILGAIAGSEASSITVEWFGLSTENLLYVCMFLLLPAIVFIYFIQGESQKTDKKKKTDKQSKQIESFTKAVKHVGQSKYQLAIAAIIGLTMITTTFTDYQFKAIAFEVYPEKSDLTSFMGTFYAGVSLASLGIQVLLSSQIIKKLGLTGAVLSRPAGMMIGAILMVIEPVLASVVILNGFDGATRYSIDKTGRELLFLPLPQHIKEQTKVFIDIFVDRFSRGIGGVLLLGFIVLLNWSPYMLTYMVIALLLIWIMLGIKVKRGYVDKFRHSVQKQLIGTDSLAIDLNESSIYSVFRESLKSEDSTQLLHTLHLLDNSNTEKIAEDLKPLLKYDNSEIRLKALKLLQNNERHDFSQEVMALLEDEEPEIRLEAIYYLCQHSKEDPTAVIKSYLEKDDLKLKSAAFGCASKHGDSAVDLVDTDFFEKLMSQTGKDAIVIKAQIADALGYIEDDSISRKYLSKLLEDEHPSVVRKTITSMGRLQNDRFIPLLIEKMQDFKYRFEIRKALSEYGKDRLLLYKDRFFDENLSDQVHKSIPGIFAYVDDQASVNHLLEMLDTDRPDVRYHVIKALNKLHRENPSLNVDDSIVQKRIHGEALNYFKLLNIRQIQPGNLPNQILLRAITEKMEQTKERIFRLLGLIYPTQDIYGSYLTLQSISSVKRSAAIEFLDNILRDKDHRLVFPIVDDRDDDKKIKIGRDMFELTEKRYDEGILQLIEGDDLWLKVCAIYSVSSQCPQNLQIKVKEAIQSSNEMIRETAELVQKRNSKKQNS
ncbi:MAG: Npt1/Npt2 family nucleotide transporter [Balneolaceae bacterium]|nr:Npt1/Npt2 family nucleotide transporter [Balneolaceae bacterium]